MEPMLILCNKGRRSIRFEYRFRSNFGYIGENNIIENADDFLLDCSLFNTHTGLDFRNLLIQLLLDHIPGSPSGDEKLNPTGNSSILRATIEKAPIY